MRAGRRRARWAPLVAVLLAPAACATGSPTPARSNGSTVTTPTVTTPGVTTPGATAPAAGGADPLEPVTVFELAEPVVRYQEQVAAGLARLETQVGALARDVAAGELDAARADWLTAHLTYHRLGAAYGAFGDLGEAVDRLEHGLPGGTADPGFTGFHRVELALWSAGGTAAAGPPTGRLLHDVHALRGQAAALEITPNDFTVRAHEILEDTLQFQLTGRDDYGSGSSLETAQADLDGTRAVVALLRPVVVSRRPVLAAEVASALDGVDAALAAARRAGGGRLPAVTALPPDRRRRVDAAVDNALEALAPLPGLLAVEDEND